MRRLRFLIPAAVAVALLTGGSGGAQGVKEGGTFRVGMLTILTGSIDPALIEQLGTGQLLNAACATLVNFPDKPFPAGLRLAPEVAAGDPVISRDGRTYTFTIRKGFRFNTGAPLTARDFAASINRILKPGLKAPAGNTELFLGIVGAQRALDGKAETASGVIVERDKLIVRLRKPDPAFVSKIWFLCPLPASLAKAALDPEGSIPKGSAHLFRAPARTSSPSTSPANESSSS